MRNSPQPPAGGGSPMGSGVLESCKCLCCQMTISNFEEKRPRPKARGVFERGTTLFSRLEAALSAYNGACRSALLGPSGGKLWDQYTAGSPTGSHRPPALFRRDAWAFFPSSFVTDVFYGQSLHLSSPVVSFPFYLWYCCPIYQIIRQNDKRSHYSSWVTATVDEKLSIKKIQYLSYIFSADVIIHKYFRTNKSVFFIKLSCPMIILQNP